MQSRTGSQVAQGGRFEESRGRGERAGSAEHAWSAAKAKRRASDAFFKTLTVTSNPKRSAVTQRPVTVSPVTACHVLLLRGVKRSGHAPDEWLGIAQAGACTVA